MTTTLITGDRGFIGSALAAHLVKAGWHVGGIDRENGTDLSTLIGRRAFYKAAGKADLVFHLAGNANVGYCQEHPVETHQDVVNTTMVLDFCAEKHIPVVVASSGMVFGNLVTAFGEFRDILPVMPHHPINPVSVYAQVKAQIEKACTYYREQKNLTCSVVRFANVYGHGQDKAVTYKSTFLMDTIRRLSQPNVECRVNNPWHMRDYLYIGDAVRALQQVAMAGQSGIYHISSGEAVPNFTVAMRCQRLLKSVVPVIPGETFPQDLPVLVLQPSLSKPVWEPLVSLDEGILMMAESLHGQ